MQWLRKKSLLCSCRDKNPDHLVGPFEGRDSGYKIHDKYSKLGNRDFPPLAQKSRGRNSTVAC